MNLDAVPIQLPPVEPPPNHLRILFPHNCHLSTQISCVLENMDGGNAVRRRFLTKRLVQLVRIETVRDTSYLETKIIEQNLKFKMISIIVYLIIILN